MMKRSECSVVNSGVTNNDRDLISIINSASQEFSDDAYMISEVEPLLQLYAFADI